MRWIASLLVVVNIVLAGLIYLRQTRPNPDGQIVNLQMNADQIRVIPPRARSSRPDRTACLEWRSFGAGELARARAALSVLALGERLSSRETEITAGWWVYMPAQNSQPNMDKKAQELRNLGITEYLPLTEAGPWRYAISLGVFRSEQAATDFLQQLREKGVRSAVVGDREHRITHTVLTIRQPSIEESERLAEIASRFSGTELRAIQCPA